MQNVTRYIGVAALIVLSLSLSLLDVIALIFFLVKRDTIDRKYIWYFGIADVLVMLLFHSPIRDAGIHGLLASWTIFLAVKLLPKRTKETANNTVVAQSPVPAAKRSVKKKKR